MKKFLKYLLVFIISYTGVSVFKDSISLQTPRSYVHQIIGEHGAGSVVVVAPDYALTAAHVAIMSEEQKVLIDGLPIIKYWIDRGNDIALLHVPGLKCPCAPIGVNAEVLDKVVAAGYPLGHLFSTEGRVQSYEMTEIRYIKFPLNRTSMSLRVLSDTQIAPGASGGGLFSYQLFRWRLVGITVEITDVKIYRFTYPVYYQAMSVPIGTIEHFLHSLNKQELVIVTHKK